mgnify:CR=1 FL=1
MNIADALRQIFPGEQEAAVGVDEKRHLGTGWDDRWSLRSGRLNF